MSRSAAFSPDGQRIVTASGDETARVWNAATGQQLAKLEGHTDHVVSAAFSPDGQRIVTASEDETARVWNAATGQQVAKLEGHTGAVYSAAFSPDGQRIVTASEDKTARVWNAATGQQLAKLDGHTGDVYSAAFSPDGQRIVTASGDKTARVWNAATGQQVATLGRPYWSVSAPRFPRTVNASSPRALIRRHGSGTRPLGSCWRKLEGHTDSVDSAAFSPDGQRIVTASYDQTARVWNAATGQQLAKLEGHTGSVDSAAFSPDGQRIVTASGDQTARVWNAATGQQLAKLEGHAGSSLQRSVLPGRPAHRHRERRWDGTGLPHLDSGRHRQAPPLTRSSVYSRSVLVRTWKLLIQWWPGTESNRRRQPFQGCALPAELPGHETRCAGE